MQSAYAATIQLPRTGLGACYDSVAKQIACPGTGQDGELQKGVAWPKPRFTNLDGTAPVKGSVVVDQLTGLMWTKDANLPAGVVTWQQALDYVAKMNAGAGTYGYNDWRLPNLNEMLSLGDISQSAPALPKGHPFVNFVPLFMYWSSSTYIAQTDHAWGVVMSWGRAAYANKLDRNAVWPVRTARPEETSPSGAIQLPKTGQTICHNSEGKQIACLGTGQDGDLQKGVAWPSPRFTNLDGTTPVKGAVVVDQLTGLTWARDANLAYVAKTWQQALDYIASLNAGAGAFGYNDWRMPNINEISSLMDISRTGLALPDGHPFSRVQPKYYWSSSENCMHKEVAWGVMTVYGRLSHDAKPNRNFVWPVRGGK